MVCIGGLGGSGTRVVAQIIKNCGYFIGHEQNDSLDNLLFTRLFKNPKWYSTSNDIEKKRRIELFNKIMNCEAYDERLFYKSILNNDCHITEKNYKIQPFSTIKSEWASKEPNSQIYIKELAQNIPKLKFILVLRNGLDMALSNNTQQLNNWGKLLFDIEFIEKDKNSIINAQLQYWISITTKAIQDGDKYLGSNFLISNFDRLCSNPEYEIKRIIEFLNIDINEQEIKTLCLIPKPPKPSRYLNSHFSFQQSEVDHVNKLLALRNVV